MRLNGGRGDGGRRGSGSRDERGSRREEGGNEGELKSGRRREERFDGAGGRTAVTGRGIAVIALLGRFGDAVAAEGSGGDERGSFPLAGEGTAVTGEGVAVIALLRGFEEAVAADHGDSAAALLTVTGPVEGTGEVAITFLPGVYPTVSADGSLHSSDAPTPGEITGLGRGGAEMSNLALLRAFEAGIAAEGGMRRNGSGSGSGSGQEG